MPVEAPRSVYLFKLDCEINLWIGDRPSEAGLASIRCLPVPPRCWHGAPVADLHGVHKRPGLLARAAQNLVATWPASPLRQHCSSACTPGERAGRTCPRARRRPPALPPKAGETVWQDDPRSNSGAITISMVARTVPPAAATSFLHDDGEHDKTGDESGHHPQ